MRAIPRPTIGRLRKDSATHPQRCARGRRSSSASLKKNPKKLRGPWNPNRENRQVGSARAGRLISAGGGIDAEDTEAQSVAADVGISGGAASAEEAAVHIISEEDLENPGDDEDDES